MLYTVDTIQDPAIKYLTSKGEVELRPWWTNYGCMFTEHLMIKLHYEWFKLTQVQAAQWESQLRTDVAFYYATEEPASTSDDAVDTNETMLIAVRGRILSRHSDALPTTDHSLERPDNS